MAKPSGEPNPIQSGVESENNADLDQASDGSVSQEKETAANQISATSEGPGKSQDWWSSSPSTSDWAQPAPNDETSADDVSKESTTAHVHLCCQTRFFPLNRALQAIGKEKLSGSLRLFWDQEPIDLLT